jgi:putative spermidine/putrescine transport system permease protein
MSNQSAGQEGARPAPPSSTPRRRAWLGIVPFAVFALAFMILPAGSLLVGSFQTPQGAFT